MGGAPTSLNITDDHTYQHIEVRIISGIEQQGIDTLRRNRLGL